MITNLQVSSNRARSATIALATLLLLAGAAVARASEAASAVPATTVLDKTTVPKGAVRGVSARALVAEADADLAAGHPGPAILRYERARLVAPRAPAVTTGLARARSVAGLPATDTSVEARIMGNLDANEWGWIGVGGLFFVGGSLVALSWTLLRRRGLLALFSAGVGLAGLGFLGAVEVTPPPNRAVVVIPNAIARIAPFSMAEPAFAVPEGAIVTVERTHDHYTLIAGPEGRGWVPAGGVEIILPAAG